MSEQRAAIAEPGGAGAMPFHRDDEISFPAGGALFLLALMTIAIWVWWIAPRRSGGVSRAALLSARFSPRAPGGGASARVVESTRLGVSSTLHVVEWKGAQILLAVNGASAPVVIGRDPVVEPTAAKDVQ